MTITTKTTTRARILRQATTPTRGTVVKMATASVLAGLAVAASTGTAAATPSTPLPIFTGSGSSETSSNLEDMLLTAREASSAIGAPRLTEALSGSALANIAIKPAQCASAYAPFQASAYRDTDPQGVAYKVVSDGKKGSVAVTEAVVQLPSKRDSVDYVNAAAAGWNACKGRTVSDADGNSWVLGAPMINQDNNIVTLSQTAAAGSSTCERAIGSLRGVVVDTMVCSIAGDAEGQAAAVTAAIAEKANSQPA